MKPLGSLKNHVLLVKRMALATDVDVTRSFADGHLSQGDWADLVQTCRGCQSAVRCGTWLPDHASASCAPQGCLNRARFEDLRRQQQEA